MDFIERAFVAFVVFLIGAAVGGLIGLIVGMIATRKADEKPKLDRYVGIGTVIGGLIATWRYYFT